MNRIAPDLRSLARPLASLRPDPKNARVHGDDNLAAIMKSLEAHGQRKPIVVRNGVVIAGNGTLAAAQRLGWTEIACAEYEGSEEEARAFALADNRASDLAAYDPDILAATLKELDGAGLLDATGYDEAALETALAAAEALEAGDEPETTDPEPADGPPANAASVPGEIYALGKHLLLCGDSTDTEAVERLFLDGAPTHVFTDPPYGIVLRNNVSASHRKRQGSSPESFRPNATRLIANDDRSMDDLAAKAFAAVGRPVEAAFVCCNWRCLAAAHAAMESVGWEPKACIVWDKRGPRHNLDLYAKSHEFILYSGPFGGEETKDNDVWSFQRDFKVDHPTPKPVPLIEHALKTMPRTAEAPTVYDPFAGSGSTLLAAEATGCRALLVELDTGYCDLIRRRWTAYAKERGLDPGTGALEDSNAST